MNTTCITKLNKIEKREAAKNYLRGRRAMLVPVSEKPKVRNEEFKGWKSSGGPESKWRVGTLKKTDLGRNGFGSINKTVIEKPKMVAKTPERYGYTPKHIREMIKKNRTELDERIN